LGIINPSTINSPPPQLQQEVGRKKLGNKREQASHKTTIHLPVTLTIMRQIKTIITTKPWNHHTAMMWAACCVALFGYLWCSEFTSPGVSQYDPTIYLI